MNKVTTLSIELDEELKKEFKKMCEKNKTTVNDVIKEYCIRYIKSGGISDLEAEQSKRLNGIPT